MQVLIFYGLALKTPIHAPFWAIFFWGGFDFINVKVYNVDLQKATTFAKIRHLRLLSVKITPKL